MPVNIYVQPTHGCYRCGTIEGDFNEDENGVAICDHCGERSVVSFQQALDLLNDFHLSGHKILTHHPYGE